MESKFFKAFKINDHVTRIEGFAMHENCYLVEGEERALLIDGLLGVGRIRQFVRELTDKPVNLVLTHGHIDHSGAAWEYPEVYLHPDDIALMYARGGVPKRFEKGNQKDPSVTLEDVPEVVPTRTYPVVEGDIFDLGGRQLEVVEIAGHSKGSIGLLDRDDRILYLGDGCLACEPVRLNFVNSSTTVEEYRDSLVHMTEYLDAFDVIWSGHDHDAVDKSVITRTLEAANLVLEGKDDAVNGMCMGAPVIFAWEEGTRLPNIIYLPGCVNKKEKKNVIKARPIVFG